MNIFKEAKQKQLEGKGYFARRFKMLCKSKNIPSNYLSINYGIRRSDKIQLFPIWNTSHNCQRALLFGFWKIYFEVSLHRKNPFNQNRKLLLRKPLWRFYQLVA